MQKYSFLSSLLERVTSRGGAWKYCDARSLIIELINFCPDNSFREMNFSSAKLCLFHELDWRKYERSIEIWISKKSK